MISCLKVSHGALGPCLVPFAFVRFLSSLIQCMYWPNKKQHYYNMFWSSKSLLLNSVGVDSYSSIIYVCVFIILCHCSSICLLLVNVVPFSSFLLMTLGLAPGGPNISKIPNYVLHECGCWRPKSLAGIAGPSRSCYCCSNCGGYTECGRFRGTCGRCD